MTDLTAPRNGSVNGALVLKLTVAVLSGMILAGVLGGITLWRDFGVLSADIHYMVKAIDDHENRLRVIEHGQPH